MRYLTRSQYVAWCLVRWLLRVLFFGALTLAIATLIINALTGGGGAR